MLFSHFIHTANVSAYGGGDWPVVGVYSLHRPWAYTSCSLMSLSVISSVEVFRKFFYLIIASLMMSLVLCSMLDMDFVISKSIMCEVLFTCYAREEVTLFLCTAFRCSSLLLSVLLLSCYLSN